MVDVILTRPVTHDGENLVPGDTISGLAEKAAARLVNLQAARYADSAPAESPKAPPDDSGDDGDAAGNGAKIARMKKSELVAALAEAGVEASDREKVDDLRAKLTAAWSAGTGGGGGEDGDPSPEEEEIRAMSREELLAALDSAGIVAEETDSDEQLRDRLRKAWGEPNVAGEA